MSDRRRTPATARVALERLRGVVDRPAYTQGRPAAVSVPVADLRAAPAGARDRQLNFGQAVTVIDDVEGWRFVEAAADGYCGWIAADALATRWPAATHRVAVPATHVYTHPDIKRGERLSLSLGAEVAVEAEEGHFARLATGGFVPLIHLTDRPATDPVEVAQLLLGTPYLWGGNSRWGIDCSGLVQAALRAAAVPCPGDSDQQWAEVGVEVPLDQVRRGDLLFWRGHVAMAVSGETLIHANGHSMSVAFEGLRATLDRIEAAKDGPFLGVKRFN